MIEPSEVTVSYSSLDTRFNPQSDLKDTSNQDIEAAAQAEKKDPRFHEIAQRVELAAYDFINQQIASLLAQHYPDFYQTYKLPPPPTIIAYVLKNNLLGNYYGPQHIITVNFSPAYLGALLATVHETSHSISRGVNQIIDTYDPKIQEHTITSENGTSGLYVIHKKSHKEIHSGQMINEGLTEYLATIFVLESDSPEAELIRHKIGEVMSADISHNFADPFSKEAIRSYLFHEYFIPNSYGEAQLLIDDLLKFDSELYPILICSYVCPRAKFQLIQRLRQMYGLELTRDLFRATMGYKNSFVPHYGVSQLRHRILGKQEVLKELRSNGDRELIADHPNSILGKVKALTIKLLSKNLR